MAKGFKESVLNIYSNFMKYTIKNSLFNIFLTIIENMPILFALDLYQNDILTKFFSPLYFLMPSIYLELLNEKLQNECSSILNLDLIAQAAAAESGGATSVSVSASNITNLTDALNSTISAINSTISTTNTASTATTADILEVDFLNNILFSLDNSYCVYSTTLSYLSVACILVSFILFFMLTFLDPRKPNAKTTTASFILTNTINLIYRPFGLLILTVLFNNPLLMLYKNQYINDSQFGTQIALTIISVIFITLFCISNSLYVKYINNAYFFEDFPYDYYSTSDGQFLLVIKVFVAFKINFNKIPGLKQIKFVEIFLIIFLLIRLVVAITNRKLVINQIHYKNIRNYFNSFFVILILLKVINTSAQQLSNFSTYSLSVELILIIVLLVLIKKIIFHSEEKFTFKNEEDFLEEIFYFLYFVGTQIKNTKKFRLQTESTIDNIIIGHKMKCTLEECVLCGEDIYNPDLKTLFMILYQQFLIFEKEIKEEDEGIALILRLIFLEVLDDKKIHRISLVVLKNSKINFPTYLKMYHLYNDLLDNINKDLKNLMTIKYGEVYDELLHCIGVYEEIFGFIKSRSEKVELVISKTNQIGTAYDKLLKDLFMLKRNKRIYFDSSNMLQIICIIRLLFHKNVNTELLDNLEYNFLDFLEGVDKIFEDNISFLIRYDFANSIWRIKKIPKKFVDITKFKMSDLIDQSIEKIFPHFLGKNIVKKLEDLILSNIIDQNLVFKTFVCDSETNVKYVKFDIDIVPNLEGNYILMMNCHFHRRQLLIVDEFGNFVNGSEMLYKKMGINAEMVTASKGKINMFNVFNLPRTSKLEEVKIVSISDEGIFDTTKNVFLLESNITGNVPDFLDEFMKKKKRKEKNLVYLNLFETMHINEIKYFVFTIKINTNEEARRKGKANVLDNLPNKAMEKLETKLTHTRGHTVKRRESISSSVNSDENNNITSKDNLINKETLNQNKESLNPDNKELINTANKESGNANHQNNQKNPTPAPMLKKNTRNFPKKTIGGEEESKNIEHKETNLNTYQNYLEYYNYFYDTHRSASVTIDYNAINLGSSHSSQGNTANSDLFSFLYIKNVVEKKRSNKFLNFLYCIYIFNFCLVLLGLISIVFIYSYSSFINQFIDNYTSFNTFRSRVFSTTANFFTVIKYEENESNGNYNDYINQEIFKNTMTTNFDYDYYIKMNMQFHAENIMLELNNYFNFAYSFFGQSLYYETINYKTDFIYFNSIGSYMIRQEYLKNEFGLFSLTSNEIATSYDMKTFLNISYFDFVTGNESDKVLAEIDINHLSTRESNSFQATINIYQYLFNYFSVFYKNINAINTFFFSYGNDHLDNLQTNSKALLIVIILLNIIFVLISFLSILIYKRILVIEFNTLYSINGEHLDKLKEKFRYVRELIKQEHYPSKIYNQLRRLKETESSQGTETKKKPNKKGNGKRPTMNSRTNRTGTAPDNISVANDTGLADMYLSFAGAKSSLQRSYTSKIKSKIEKIKKESSQAQASSLLLSRLNFEFELITVFIYFISFMTLFYLFMGFLILYMLDDKFNAMKVSLKYTDLFLERNSDLYNYYISVKLSLMFNKHNPYTIPSDNNCVDCNFELLTSFNNNTEEINKLEASNTFLADLYNNHKLYIGSSLCDELYNKPNDLIDYLIANSTIAGSTTENLITLCKKIPILQSNIDTVFTNMMVSIRNIYDEFRNEDPYVEMRISLLQKSFRLIDILFGIFAEPYLSYIKHVLLIQEITTVKNSYFNFIVIIFSINIFIDFFMLLYIWFKIYKQIIRSVNNVHLVTDSVSVI